MITNVHEGQKYIRIEVPLIGDMWRPRPEDIIAISDFLEEPPDALRREILDYIDRAPSALVAEAMACGIAVVGVVRRGIPIPHSRGGEGGL